MRSSVLLVALCLAAMGGTAWAATQIQLVGNVSRKCTLSVTPDPGSTSLNLTAAGEQRIPVGTLAQDCNGNVDFQMQVFSANCVSAPVGAKLVDAASGEYLRYAAEAENPATGGSAPLVAGLLAAACSGQVAREVVHGHVRNELSTLYIRYSGSSALSAGAYQDMLTITLTVN